MWRYPAIHTRQSYFGNALHRFARVNDQAGTDLGIKALTWPPSPKKADFFVIAPSGEDVTFLNTVTLFGSRACGTAREGSDFDLIVRVKSRTDETREVVLDVNVEMMDEFEVLFMGILYDDEEWSRTRRFPLGWSVDREGISL